MIVYSNLEPQAVSSTETFPFYIARNLAKYVHLKVPLTVLILLFNIFIVDVGKCYCLHSS